MKTRNQRERDRLRKERAQRWAQEAAEQVARPSEYGILHLSAEVASEFTSAISYGRTSKGENHSLTSQRRCCKEAVKKFALPVQRGFFEKASGKIDHLAERYLFKAAVERCRSTGALLIVPCFSRLLRAACYDLFLNRDAGPSREEIEALMVFLNGVTVACVADPDSSPEEDRAFLSNLSRETTGNVGGRPHADKMNRKDFHAAWFPTVLRLSRKMVGKRPMGTRRIANRIMRKLKKLHRPETITHQTVSNWLKKAGERP